MVKNRNEDAKFQLEVTYGNGKTYVGYYDDKTKATLSAREHWDKKEVTAVVLLEKRKLFKGYRSIKFMW